MTTITRDTPLLGPVDLTVDDIVAAVPEGGPYTPAQVRRIAEAIVAETERYGLRTSLVAAQILIETNRFRYGGQVDPDQFNFAGIGATDDGRAGHPFTTIQEGVRAVVQHHYAYLGLEPMDPIVDPRFDLVSRRVETIGEYGNGVWATDPGYADKIVSLANSLTGDAMSLIQTIGARLSARGVEVHDLRNQLARGGAYPRISRAAQRYTAIHYTGVVRQAGTLANDVTSWKGHASYHVGTHGWPGIAYCLGVSLSGRAFLLHEVEEMGYHAYNANSQSFPISVDMGMQEPTEAALRALATVVDVLHEETPELPSLDFADTYGHTELTFLDKRNITACPGLLLPYVQRYRASGGVPVDSDPLTVTFPTGITMNTTYGFYRYWEVEGGVAELGYPISEELTEDGQTVQYFERARLEYAQDGSILRGLVGSEAYAARHGEAMSNEQ